MNKLAAVLAGTWLGLQLGVGYLVAPILFQNMGRMEAGALAGVMFNVVAYTGMAVWLLVYFIGRAELSRHVMRSYTNKFVLALLSFLAVNQFLVTPVIEAHKAGKTNWLLSLIGGSFGQWHGISSIIYMICSVLALGLVFRLLKLDWY
ncbi:MULTISPECIES: DUF4149 domain-containing protein [unclassified Neisseria]|uniref:DUF4149 domain-containing protein n=1 Tax=unclassified Neisseria TaxID=2623750 RepID=UPI002666D6A6|nr:MULTISPECIES: DUF4149 domain-containing protein [unclassified Neisseria]MDO1508993.1 DUF4149 domain-containing protein [Neisseria sp. MVDL19-042950]MDO1515252.1 DUF4149 domain-containing protein [Neisseria sp. MVDL18-041461]MDO1562612.1 DUF4149 domain-containing protein [Neisseria sp. MVDL20-010259]